MNRKPKFSVIVITYNQENVIERALNSLLIQKEWLHEIIICDDCSTDNNWNIILEYANKYEIIKPFRNEKNLGIFGNIESTWSKPSGDVIFYLSGDDAYCNGIFAEADKLIKKNNIDIDNGFFTLYFDYITIRESDGKTKIHSNKYIQNFPDAVNLKLRGLICNRTTGISGNVLKSHKKVKRNIGIYADSLIDIQTQLYSKQNYYSPFVGSIYYTGIGIAARTKVTDHLQSYALCKEEALKSIQNLSINNFNIISYQYYSAKFQINPSLLNFIKMITYFTKQIDVKYGLVIMLNDFKKLLLKIICGINRNRIVI